MRAREFHRMSPAEARAFFDEQNARVLGTDLPLRPKTKKRAKRVKSEEPIHIAIKNYLESVLPPDWIVHHSRNGGMSKAENGRAKAMGAKAGWLDLVIIGEELQHAIEYVPAMWFIEVKDDDGVLSDDQKKFCKKLDGLGVPWGVARSIDDARTLIQKWCLPNRDLALKG